jgi:hypothetical protein
MRTFFDKMQILLTQLKFVLKAFYDNANNLKPFFC